MCRHEYLKFSDVIDRGTTYQPQQLQRRELPDTACGHANRWDARVRGEYAIRFSSGCTTDSSQAQTRRMTRCGRSRRRYSRRYGTEEARRIRGSECTGEAVHIRPLTGRDIPSGGITSSERTRRAMTG